MSRAPDKTITELLKAHIKAAPSKRALSRAANVKYDIIRKFLLDETDLMGDTINRICRALDVTLAKKRNSKSQKKIPR